MRRWRLGVWRAPLGVAVAAHAALALLPVMPAPAEPLETVSFSLVDLPLPEPEPPPPEPEPPPPEPEPPPPLPAGELVDEPERDPDRTSLESNRPDDAVADAEVPPVTGLPLDAATLAPEGEGMAVRVGNTNTAGFDADVAPGELRGFQGEGRGGGGRTGAAARGLDAPPRVLRSFRPPFPKELVKLGVEGRVHMMVRVGANGRAQHVEVLSAPHPRLGVVAQAAVMRFRFKPGRLNGRKVEASMKLVIHFKIVDGAR